MQLIVLITCCSLFSICVSSAHIDGFEIDEKEHLLSYSINSAEESSDVDLEETPSSAITPPEKTSMTTATSAICPKCSEADDERQKHLDYIKAMILDKLNMTDAPHLNVSMSIPSVPHLKHLIGPSDVQGDHPVVEPEEYVFHTKKITSLARKRPNSPDCCYFAFSSQIRQHKVRSARLWIYVQPGKTKQYTTTTLDLKIYGLRKSGDRSKDLIGSSKIPTRVNSGYWTSFSVKQVVEVWFGDPSKNLGLEIDFPNNGDNAFVVTGPLENENKERPHLEIRLFPSDHSRTPTVQDCPARNVVSYCCRRPLRVDFRQPGYNWVIAPASYDAFYCSGECNGMHVVETSHAQIMASTDLKLCCNPSLLQPISMVYFSDMNTIIQRLIPDMVVARCECS